MDTEDLYQSIVERWRINAKGKGLINFTKKIKPYPVILGILQRRYSAVSNSAVYIVVDKIATRTELIDYLTKTDNEENNQEFKGLIKNKFILIHTVEQANSWTKITDMDLLITINIITYEPFHARAFAHCKFWLICTYCYSMDNHLFMRKCVSIASDEIHKLIKVYENSPVEEYQIALSIDDPKELELLDKYNRFISDSAKILGGFDRIDLIKNGNPLCNVSSTQVCLDIARENGWSEGLDMSIEFNKQIDAIYNPLIIRERAEQVYDLIRKRRKLVSENTIKLNAILNIVRDNIDKKILIINKSSEFAKVVTAYINEHIQGANDGFRQYDACYNYHDDLDKIQALDRFGNPILVKSGASKGQIKMLAAKAQKSLANDYLLTGCANIISSNSAPDKALSAQIDLVIITSPLCLKFTDYKYRLDKCEFLGNPFKVFVLYMENTLEEKELCKETQTENYTIVNNSEKTTNFDENLGAIVVC